MTKISKKEQAARSQAGREFITSLVGSFPEGELRTKLAEILTDDVLAGDDAAAAATFAGTGVLRESDFSRQSDETRATLKTQTDTNTALKTRLDDWYGTNQAKLAEFDDMAAKVATLEAAAAAGGPDPDPDPTKDPAAAALPAGFDPAKFITTEAMDKALLAREESFLGFHRISQRIGLQHFADFGEVLDEDTILKHPNVREIGFEAAYADVFKDQIAERKTKIDTEASTKLEGDLRKKWEAEQQASAARPWPSPTGEVELGTLTRLHKEQATRPGGSAAVDAAVKGYLEATQAPPA